MIRIAWLNLFWEKIWPRLLPPLAVCGLFLAVALFDFLPMLPFWLHIVALAMFAVIFAYNIRGLVGGDYNVDERCAMRRVETDSGVAHRPLEALDDMPFFHPADVDVLWRLHKARMQAFVALGSLPSPGMARYDPFGFRAALLMIMVIAGAAGIGDARARLERALTPEPATFSEVGLSINLWITRRPTRAWRPSSSKMRR